MFDEKAKKVWQDLQIKIGAEKIFPSISYSNLDQETTIVILQCLDALMRLVSPSYSHKAWSRYFQFTKFLWIKKKQSTCSKRQKIWGLARIVSGWLTSFWWYPQLFGPKPWLQESAGLYLQRNVWPWGGFEICLGMPRAHWGPFVWTFLVPDHLSEYCAITAHPFVPTAVFWTQWFQKPWQSLSVTKSSFQVTRGGMEISTFTRVSLWQGCDWKSTEIFVRCRHTTYAGTYQWLFKGFGCRICRSTRPDTWPKPVAGGWAGAEM